MADEGLNLFECAAECVRLCPQEEECTLSYWEDSKMHPLGTAANSERPLTKINKNAAIAEWGF